MSVRILIGDALERLEHIADESVQCTVTSPPYWRLRSYLPETHPLKSKEIGNEETPEEYVVRLVEVLRAVRRTLCKEGSLWLNLGDCYNSGASGGLGGSTLGGGQQNQSKSNRNGRIVLGSVKAKDLIGIPWMVAFALRVDGWYLRSHCPWIKRNGMPDSCTSRPTTTIESMFLLTKSPDCFYDTEAVRKIGRIKAGTRGAKGSVERGAVHGVNARPPEYKIYDGTRLRRSSDWFFDSIKGLIGDDDGEPLAFVVNTTPYAGAHFATFPPELIKPCVLASCPIGGTVLDPFAGSGTVGQVCNSIGRNAILIELNADCEKLCEERCKRPPMLLD